MRSPRMKWLVAFPIIVIGLSGAVLSPAVARPIGATVTIDDGVSPSTVTVPPGEVVEFTNQGSERHQIRNTSGPDDFSTGDIGPGESAGVVLSIVGTYIYEDHRNDHDARYVGTIIVATTGNTDPAPAPPTAPTGTSVDILDRSFSPASISVGAGSTVNWTNVSGRDHTVTADDRSFDSGDMAEGAAWSKTFDAPGSYAYFCIIHPDMRGIVVVSDTGTPLPPPPAPPPPPPIAPPPPPNSTPTSPGDGPATGTINIVDFAFDPGSTSIRVGDTIVWRNFGIAPHTVTADDLSFDSGFLNTGQSYQRTFTEAGSYSYFCTIHPDMRAVLAVGAADAAPPPTPPLPPAPPQTPAAPESPVPGGGPSSSSGTVDMVDFAFRPSTINTRVGDTVVWANIGEAPHTATARDNSFDTGFVMAGERASTRLTQAGTFAFYCTIHPQMTGTLVVADAPTGLDLSDESAAAPVESVTESVAQSSSEGASPAVPEGDATAIDEGRLSNVTVEVVDFDFDARRIEIEQGTTVSWEWTGDAPHTVTEREGAFDSGILQKGATWSRSFDEVGTIAYYCTLHPDMIGVIDVVAPRVDDSAIDTTLIEAMPSMGTGLTALDKGLVGGAILLLGGAVFLFSALLFMRWAVVDEDRFSSRDLHGTANRVPNSAT